VVIELKKWGLYGKYIRSTKTFLNLVNVVYAVKFVMSNYIQFELFLIIPIGHHCFYSLYNLTKIIELNNLTQEIY